MRGAKEEAARRGSAWGCLGAGGSALTALMREGPPALGRGGATRKPAILCKQLGGTQRLRERFVFISVADMVKLGCPFTPLATDGCLSDEQWVGSHLPVEAEKETDDKATLLFFYSRLYEWPVLRC